MISAEDLKRLQFLHDFSDEDVRRLSAVARV